MNPALLVLETVSTVLSLCLLIAVAMETNGHTATAADGLSVTVTSFAMLIGLYRMGVLVNSVTNLQRRESQPSSSGEFLLLSGYYLTILWAILHIGLSLAKPTQSYFFVVSPRLMKYRASSNIVKAKLVCYGAVLCSSTVTLQATQRLGGNDVV